MLPPKTFLVALRQPLGPRQSQLFSFYLHAPSAFDALVWVGRVFDGVLPAPSPEPPGQEREVRAVELVDMDVVRSRVVYCPPPAGRYRRSPEQVREGLWQVFKQLLDEHQHFCELSRQDARDPAGAEAAAQAQHCSELALRWADNLWQLLREETRRDKAQKLACAA
jgi:hypothetical protein